MQSNVEDIVRLYWQLDHLLVGWARKHADFPFSVNTFLALEFINQDGPLPMKCIAEMMEITPASTTALVGKLEDSGWVQRQHDKKDQRISLVLTTEAGKAALEDYYHLMGSFFIGRLAGDQQDQLVNLLQELVTADSHRSTE